MKKLLFLLLFSSICFAQTKLNEYKASNGIIYKIGDTITLGRGSGVQGSFVYVTVGGWVASGESIGAAYSGTNVFLKKIKSRKWQGKNEVWFVVDGGNIANYNLIIEPAIESCEIKGCVNSQAEVKIDKFDRLKKLKELHDNGTLSNEEFDIEKKKLLEEK